MTQKEIILNATQAVATRKKEAEALKILMIGNSDYRTLDNLVKVIEFDPLCLMIEERNFDLVVWFSKPADDDYVEGFLAGFDFEYYGDNIHVSEVTDA